MRHLIFLFDGTNQYAGRRQGAENFTNIHNLNLRLGYRDSKANEQIVFYTRGLGSGGPSVSSTSALGKGIWQPIEDAYINICSNLHEDDKIYIFGYSRGAVIARAVSGMISHGVLKAERLDRIDLIRALYNIDTAVEAHPERQGELIPRKDATLAEVQKHVIQRQVSIEFLGLFDTVIGGDDLTREIQEVNILPGTLAPSVKSAVHILAIDECRRLFSPSPFMRRHPKNAGATIEQIWMPGVHSDIGGGNENTALADMSLLIMIDRLLHNTSGNNLLITTTDLEQKYIKNEVSDAKVHNDLGFFEELAAYFLREPREIFGLEARLHPVVKQFKESGIVIDGQRQYYADGHPVVGNLVDPSFSDYFLSERFRGKEINVVMS